MTGGPRASDAAPVPFTKVEGLGNDFAVVDVRRYPRVEDRLVAAAQALCARRTGIGADGLLLVGDPRTPGSVAAMRIVNADGSEPEMCGNGLRCVALYLHRRGAPPALTVDTPAGPRRARIVASRGRRGVVRVDMGAPDFAPAALPMAGEAPLIDGAIDGGGRTFRATALSMGNPHLVVFEDAADTATLRALAADFGPHLERHPRFPRRTNVAFAAAAAPDTIAAVVWERGCGITLACGSGACAVAAAAVETGRAPAGTPLAIALPGGTLTITAGAPGGPITMEGPCREVFDGALPAGG